MSTKLGRGGNWSRKDLNTLKKPNNNNYKKSTFKDSELKFFIGDQQAEKFDKIVKYITAEAQKEYGYSVAYTIEYKKEFQFPAPIREVSMETDKAANEIEQKGLDLIYSQELKVLTQKKEEYAQNKEKICDMIVKKMSTTLEEMIKKEADYLIKKGTDPVWLLQKIEYYCRTY